MPQSPVTPRARRRSSGSSITQLPRVSYSRKSSIQSLNSPATPLRPPSALDKSGDYGFGLDETVPEGLDSLAAELAEEDWDEEEDSVDEDDSVLEDSGASTHPSTVSPNGAETSEYGEGITSVPLQSRGSGSGMRDEEDDIDISKVISRDLEKQISLVEALCKPDSQRAGKDSDVFQRVEIQLRDLSSQVKVEDQASKLMNTVDSLSKRLANESRHLQILLQPYLSSFAAPIDSASLESIQPLIAELISSIPAPPTTPLPAIHALNTSDTETLASLAGLTDSLYITQQNILIASQRLRSTRDIVQTIQREFREADEGLHFLQTGSWEDKLRRRVAASVCSEVVDGFEEVCQTWRRRLSGQNAVPG